MADPLQCNPGEPTRRLRVNSNTASQGLSWWSPCKPQSETLPWLHSFYSFLVITYNDGLNNYWLSIDLPSTYQSHTLALLFLLRIINYKINYIFYNKNISKQKTFFFYKGISTYSSTLNSSIKQFISFQNHIIILQKFHQFLSK